jgi:putative ABC transport system permease protein
MRWQHVLAQRLRSLFRPARIERELDDELRYHLDRQIEQLIEAGHTPDEARRLAMLDMGGIEQRREECRDTRGTRAWTAVHGTLRDALRALRRRPAAALVTIATLAVGIGGGTTMLAVVDVLMLRPPAGIVDPDRVVFTPARNYVVYSALRNTVTTVDLAAYVRPAALIGLGSGTEATAVKLECVTPSYFDVLGTRLVAGRTFDDRDTALDTSLTLVVAHHFWLQYFRGDPDAIGRTVHIARRAYTVIGAAPPNFRGVEAAPVDGWIVMEASPATCSSTGGDVRFSSWLSSVARLRDGVTRGQARAEFEALLPTIDNDPRYERAGPLVATLPTLREQAATQLAGDRRLSLWLLGGGLALLLTACANVAGLLAIRAIDRQREFAIRAQLGASRARVVAQVMAESLVLGVLSGAIAVVVAATLDRTLRGFFPFAPDDGLLGGRSVLAVAALSIFAGLVSGVAPSLQVARLRTRPTAVVGGTRRHLRARHALLVVQVAAALVLATAAGLFVKSVENARTGLGYDTDHVVVASVDFERAGYRRQAQIQEFFDRLVARANDAPGVERVALSVNAPLGTSGSGVVRALASNPDGPPPKFHSMNTVSPGYFATIGTRVVRGREFLDSDDAASAPVIIVDEELASTLWPDDDAVGECAYFFPDRRCMEVVGITERRRHSTITRPVPEYFVSTTQPELADGHATPRALMLRLTSTSDAAVAAVATTLRSAAPDMPFVNVQRLDDLVDSRARTWRLGSTLFGLFGIAAVGLAAIGIFGTLSFAIRQRTAEIGLRLALGATQTHVVWTVTRSTVMVLTAGLVVGGVAAWFSARLLESSLFGVEPTDITAFATAALTIAAVGATASVLPCLRARRIDPIVALRTE